jgi:hypothetical protein
MILQDGMVFLLLNAAVTGVLLLNSALTGTLLLNSSPCTADAPDLPFQLICGGSDFNLFVGKLGKESLGEKLGGKMCFVCVFLAKIHYCCAIRN